ncbi:MAG: cytidylate kinase-like family protein [Pseudomonadota bacterium]
MAIITISRGSYSKGKEIAEGVAKRLGYDCISRDLLLETSEHFNIPEIKLIRALHDAPSVLERFSYGREKYLAFIRGTFLHHARADNIVYHGLAGHFMLAGVGHVLKVRVLADMEDRINLEMEREGLSKEKALKLLRKDDEERRKWTLALWGKDPWDPTLYDLIIHINRITVDDAVDIVCNTAGQKHFQATPESQKVVDDLLLAARVKIKLVDDLPNCTVSSDDGSVWVNITGDLAQEARLIDDVKTLVKGTPGVKDIRVGVFPLGV